MAERAVITNIQKSHVSSNLRDCWYLACSICFPVLIVYGWKVRHLGGSYVPLHTADLEYQNPNGERNGWASSRGQPKGVKGRGVTWKFVQDSDVVPGKWLNVTGHKIHGISPLDSLWLTKIQAMFKEPTKAYILCKTPLSIPEKSDFALFPGLLLFLSKIFLSFSFPYPIPIIKGNLLLELSS